MSKTTSYRLPPKFFSYLLIGLGMIGFLASLVLAYEKYQIALDPSHVPSCTLNPIIACESILASATDKIILGIPNSFFGIAGFTALMTVGVLLLAGAHLKDWFWKLFYGAVLTGMAVITFFISQSLYIIGSLCLYCMITWAVVIALFIYSTIWLVENNLLKVPEFLKRFWPGIAKNHFGVLIILYLFIFGLILFRFRDYFESVWF